MKIMNFSPVLLLSVAALLTGMDWSTLWIQDCDLVISGSLGASTLRVSESNGSSVFVEMLRGRDGLSGRDGERGPAGPPGPCLHQVGEDILPTSSRHWVTLLRHHWRNFLWSTWRWSQLPVPAYKPRIQQQPQIRWWSAGTHLYVQVTEKFS